MSNVKKETNEVPSGNGGPKNTTPVSAVEHPVSSVAGALAILFLQRSIDKGKVMEIPSLGIRVEKKDIS